MQQRTAAHTFANLPQTAGACSGGAKIDLAGVLDRQHMPAGDGRASGRAPPRNQPLDGRLFCDDARWFRHSNRVLRLRSAAVQHQITEATRRSLGQV
jgi:hypothetical protein